MSIPLCRKHIKVFRVCEVDLRVASSICESDLSGTFMGLWINVIWKVSGFWLQKQLQIPMYVYCMYVYIYIYIYIHTYTYIEINYRSVRVCVCVCAGVDEMCHHAQTVKPEIPDI